MGFEVLVRRKAQIDLDEVFVWYEEQKAGLGFEFLKEFENTVSKVRFNAQHASFIEADARSTSLKRIPYDVVYTIDEAKSQVRIIAIIHQNRDPEWFRQRLIFFRYKQCNIKNISCEILFMKIVLMNTIITAICCNYKNLLDISAKIYFADDKGYCFYPRI